MNVGEKYTLAWKHPHRIECEVLELALGGIVVEAVHRCSATCYLLQMHATLPIEGHMTFLYHEFEQLFVRLNPDAIALPA